MTLHEIDLRDDVNARELGQLVVEIAKTARADLPWPTYKQWVSEMAGLVLRLWDELQEDAQAN